MAKYTPKSETVYFLSMFDHDTPSLDGIVSEAVGCKYVGQQTGDMLSNDTDHTIEMITDYDIEEWMQDEDNDQPYEYYEYPTSKGIYPPDLIYYNFESWVRDRDKFDHDFKHERAAPIWQYALAWCVKNDLLPRGTYVVSVSW